MQESRFLQRPDKAVVLTGAVSGIFLFLLVFSPVAFGTVEQWSLTVMETLPVLALLLEVAGRNKGADPVFFAVPGMVPLLLFLAYMLLQLVPLPPQLLRQISPATYALYERTVGAMGPLSWMPLSINTKETIMEFFRFAAYASFYFLTVQLLARGAFLKRTVTTVILLSALLAFQGVLQYLLPNGKVLWLREGPVGGSMFGTYVNRNHFAGFMEMVFPVALSVFLAYRPVTGRGPLRERFAGLIERHQTNTFVLLGGAVILMSIAVFLSASRGGLLGLCFGLALFSVLYFNRTRDRKGIMLLAVILFLLVVAATWFGWDVVFDRFARVSNERGGRIVQWKDSIGILRDFPLTGAGFGCFQDIYKGYSGRYWDAILDHAHNDYLELLCEGGIIGFFLMGCFVLTVLYRSWRMFLKRRSEYAVLLYVGSLSGMLGILIHGMTDFNLHIGANGLYFFLLAGLAVSAAGTRSHADMRETLLLSKQYRHPQLVSLSLGLLLLAGLAINFGMLAGGHYFSYFRENGPDRREGAASAQTLQSLSYASFLDPLEAEYPYRRALTEEALDARSAALHYRKAIQAAPANSEYLQGYGLFLARIGQDEGARRLLRAATQQDTGNPERYRIFAAWLLSRHRKEEAFREIRKALSLKPQDAKEYIALLVLNGSDNEEIARALPKEPDINMMFADYLGATGDRQMASQYYQTLLGDQVSPGRLRPGYFYAAQAFYLREGMDGEALKVMQKAVSLFPDAAGMRLTYAGLLARAGQKKQAVAEYSNVLLGDPSNARARAALKQLEGP